MDKTQKKQKIIRIVFIALIIVINLITVSIFLSKRNEYTINIPLTLNDTQSVDLEYSEEGIIECTGTERSDGYFQVHLRALRPGSTSLKVTVYPQGSLESILINLSVNELGTIVRSDGSDFNQWHILLLGVLISLVLVCLLIFAEFLYRIKTDLYSHRTLRVGGSAFFILCLTLFILVAGIIMIPRYRAYNADNIMFLFKSVFELIVLFSTPVIIGFGIALSVSNIQLIRKEGFRRVNALGIILSIILFGFVFVGVILPDFILSTVNMPGFLRSIQYILIALFSFFLCFMLSTMICALIAAKRVPASEQDYIIILGCSIKKDGTLYPLIKGRVDRAIWFWKKQLHETGKKAFFIPSGGKGSDERISESEAMKRYLLQEGMPEDCILMEDKSATTYENMKFSKALIEARSKDAKVIFSTTNYHVFRSGILAGKVGLKVLGIGSKTKWYFWPNAFVREFIGLLYSAWRPLLIFFGIFAAIAVFFMIVL